MIKALKISAYGLLFIVVVLLIASLTGYDRTKIPENLVGDKTDINGLKIRYHQVGEGSDVLFIHGIPGSIEDWDSIVANMPEGYRLTRYDRPGHGFSESQSSASALSFNANIAASIIQKLRLRDVIVVGHSYGGGVALELTAKYPGSVKACVLLEPVGYAIPNLPSEFRFLTIPILGRGISSLAISFFGDRLEKEIVKKAFFPNTKLIPADYIKNRSKIWLQAKVFTTAATELTQHYMDFDRLSPNLNNIKKPVYLIQGFEDQLVPRDQATRLVKDLPNAKLLLLEHIGYQTPYARPDLVVRAIQELD